MLTQMQKAENINETTERLNASDRNYPTLPTGYTNRSTWYIKKGSKVCLYITLTKNDNTAISNVIMFKLPAGYRPIDETYFHLSGYTITNISAIKISVSGDVLVSSQDKGVYGYVEFETFS